MALDWLTGSSGGFQQLDLMNPQQQQLQQQLIGGLGGAQGAGLQHLMALLSGDPQAFAGFEQPYKTQFEQETVPGLAERFAGMGSFGGSEGSGQNLAMAQAGRQLSENLAALRGQLQNQALGQLQGFMGAAYQPSFENVYEQAAPGLLQYAAQGAGSAVGAAAGGYLGKKWGG